MPVAQRMCWTYNLLQNNPNNEKWPSNSEPQDCTPVSPPLQACDSIELPIKGSDSHARGIRLEPINDDLFDVHDAWLYYGGHRDLGFLPVLMQGLYVHMTMCISLPTNDSSIAGVRAAKG